MPHVIRWFNKDDEWVAGDVHLPDIPLSELKRVYPNSLNDTQMFDCYVLTKDQVAFFRDYTNLEFEFDKYDYFLEFDAD